MVPGGYVNKGVLLSCTGQLKMRPTHTDGDFHGKEMKDENDDNDDEDGETKSENMCRNAAAAAQV